MVHCPLVGVYTLKVFAEYYGEGKSDTFVCTYFINAVAGLCQASHDCRTTLSRGAWSSTELQQNIYAPDGWWCQHLDNSLFFSNTAEYVSTILAYAPEAGVY